jgi:hypothetical protein
MTEKINEMNGKRVQGRSRTSADSCGMFSNECALATGVTDNNEFCDEARRLVLGTALGCDNVKCFGRVALLFGSDDEADWLVLAAGSDSDRRGGGPFNVTARESGDGAKKNPVCKSKLDRRDVVDESSREGCCRSTGLDLDCCSCEICVTRERSSSSSLTDREVRSRLSCGLILLDLAPNNALFRLEANDRFLGLDSGDDFMTSLTSSSSVSLHECSSGSLIMVAMSSAKVTEDRRRLPLTLMVGMDVLSVEHSRDRACVRSWYLKNRS